MVVVTLSRVKRERKKRREKTKKQNVRAEKIERNKIGESTQPMEYQGTKEEEEASKIANKLKTLDVAG